VQSRLVSDVPFGAFLSGGLDSSVVVALMSRHLSQPVRTFSIGFREAKYNELSDARRVAQHLHTEHHELVVEPDAVEILQQLVWFLDEPFADSSAVPTYLVAKLARQHVKMVLTGDGGDEAFGGYDRYLKFLDLERVGPLKPAVAAPGKSEPISPPSSARSMEPRRDAAERRGVRRLVRRQDRFSGSRSSDFLRNRSAIRQHSVRNQDRHGKAVPELVRVDVRQSEFAAWQHRAGGGHHHSVRRSEHDGDVGSRADH
jgi:asparagine synthetase B (glutamine-hydrolysing)